MGKKFEVFARNLNAVLDAAGYPPMNHGRLVAAGKTFGVTTSAARKWLTGNCMPDYEHLILIADKLGVGLDVLFGRVPFTATQFVTIPLGSAWHSGSIVDGRVMNPISAIQMESKWVESGMRMKYNNLCMMVMSGDNMAQTISDGDVIFVDTTPTTDLQDIEENGIYLLNAGGRLHLRRIQTCMGSVITLENDNKQFPQDQVEASDLMPKKKGKPAAIQIVGRVPWAIHRVGRTIMDFKRN